MTINDAKQMTMNDTKQMKMNEAKQMTIERHKANDRRKSVRSEASPYG